MNANNEDEANKLIGSVVYEPKNSDQQSLMVHDLKNNNRQEYPIDKNMDIHSGSNRKSLDTILSEGNKKELNQAIQKNQSTSFALSKEELSNANQELLNDQRFNENIKEEDPLKQLRDQYKNYQSMLKEESKGELTQEKVINRMNAEKSYTDLKKDTLENNPDAAKDIQSMEKNVQAQQKNKQKQQGNELSM